MNVVIYQTSDIHGYVYPTNYVNDMALGMLKIGSYIHEDEKKYDAALKIDCGDLIQGSPMTHFIYQKGHKENVITKGMEAIGFDVYVLGNHEFNYGLSYLQHAYQPVEEKVLNANIEGLPIKSKPYTIFAYDGYTIACIGLTTAFVPNWEQKQHIEHVIFHDPVKMYRKYEAELKEQADLIVVCYHGGFEKSVDEAMEPTEVQTKENQASEFLEMFDSIDILLTGHQHRGLMTKVNNVICAQPEANGQSFAKIVIDTETKQCSYELMDTSSLRQAIHPRFEASFHNVQQELEQYLDQKIGHFSKDMQIHDIHKARLFGHPLLHFIHDVQRAASQAEISVTSLFDNAIGFQEHVSIRDVLVTYPYPNTLRVLKMPGYKLKEAIEISATYFQLDKDEVVINEAFLQPKAQSYNYDMYGGLSYVVDLKKPCGKRVIRMEYQGKKMDMNRMYSVVLNNYRASNTSMYPCYAMMQEVAQIQIDIRELMIEYIQTHAVIEVREEANYIFMTKDM